MAPGMKAHLWGYNGQSPGPTIEAVEGDKVRIFVTNRLPEHTTVHWHGMLLRTALALHMAAQVPCPWLRWITVGDRRAQGNDSPGPQRRVH
jgi:FtsP/CotA-like multicopper oxidase with cupredoxin domain